jgi:hypothetical protein
MSDSKPKLDPREAADRLRRTVYENHGPDAVKQAEKYIRKAVIELDQKQSK